MDDLSSYVNFDQEIKYLEKMFVKNSYPVNFFQKTVRSFLNRKFSDVLIVENSERKYILKIPFVGKPSMDFKNAFSKLFNAYFDCDISCIFTSFKVKNYFSLKSKTPFPLASNVVYKFTCLRDAEKFYIGKTSRHLAVRVKEHFDLKRNNVDSAIKNHIFSCDACAGQLNVNRFDILGKCRNDFHTKIHEAFFIKRLKPALNKQLHNSGASFLLNVF